MKAPPELVEQVHVFSTGGGDGFSVAALAISAVGLALTVFLNYRTERKSVLDVYWFRELIGPKCVSVVLRARVDILDILREAEVELRVPKDVASLLKSFNNACGQVLAEAWMAKVVSVGLYDETENILGDLEDRLATELYKSLVEPGQRALAFSAARNAVDDQTLVLLKLLRKTQEGL